MKSLFSVLAFVAALFALERAFISAETFTEGVRVSSDAVTLKLGEYVWEPERAPEGPLLIVASVTEQVFGSLDQALAQDGRDTPLLLASSRSWKKRCIIRRASIKAQRCHTWSV